MADAGYKIYLEIGSTNPSDGTYSTYGQFIELDQCSYCLTRAVDVRGKIGEDLRGGNISFTFSGVPPLVLVDWAISAGRYFSGYIHIRDSFEHPKYKVFFENATCVYHKMTYTNEGQAYLSVQCTLQAETIELPGARTLMNNWLNTGGFNSSSTVLESAENKVLSALNDAVSISTAITLADVKYELRSLEVEFGQEIDHKGEPQTSVRGGIFTLGLYNPPSEKLNYWLIHKQEVAGRITFGDDMRGYELTMDLKEVKCAGYYVDINSWSDDPVQTRLNIIPSVITFTKDLVYRVPY